jgi:hypothetical protein
MQAVSLIRNGNPVLEITQSCEIKFENIRNFAILMGLLLIVA